MAQQVFAFAGLRILVESVEASHLIWLGEFLAPHFDRPLGFPHDCRVAVVEDSERYRDILALGPAGGLVETFAFDTRIVSYPRWPPGPGGLRLHDTASEVFYEIAGDIRTITLLAESGGIGVRGALMRVVRELATNHAQRQGGLLLHASAFSVDGRGAVIAGPKEAGKTTLLIQALRQAGARYVSNDRVLVLPGPDPTTIRGVPSIVSLRRGTLALFPELADRLDRAPYNYRVRLDEPHPAGVVASVSRSGHRTVNPSQLCRLLDVRPEAQCELGAFVFPRIAPEVKTLAVRRLTSTEAVERLAGAMFGLPSRRSWSETLSPAGDPPPDLAALGERSRDLAARVPSFDCRLGERAYESPDTAGELIGSVLV